ncbi:polysaccharide export outer membrane protein [Yoonia litorea]|uniref:Polysaccharide export outer membrane protein n=1 Tax=Yoonia litorea TaxID=1123755 RepID=A0A1I6MXA3_9RHOB|nr:polysaccharide export outer membrane protein [Yoonia litorea]
MLACLALAACGLPRGAGFQSEVLAASNPFAPLGADGELYDFAYYEVNRETLPVLRNWGISGLANLPWPTAQRQPSSLIIAPGDTVQLTIWDAEENSIFGAAGVTPIQPTEVDPAGRIFVPFIGELRVAGMAPSTARQRIEEELVMTVPSAQVQLVVEAGRANTANLAAGVTAPGLYPLPQRDFSILELFSLAGGPDPTFNSPQVRLVRDGRTFGIGFDQLLQTPSLNIAVRGGDRIFVVDDERQFITLGATGSQSIFDFPSAHFTALEAIAFMGGVNAGTANPEGVLILRNYHASQLGDGLTGPPRERVVFLIDLTSADGLFSAGDFPLQDGDLIYGTESALGPFLAALGLTNSVTSTLN